MPAPWKRWKSKNRITTVPTASWKSREGSEIPTFPQLLRFVIASQPSKPCGRTGCGGKVEIQKQDSHFPTAPMACGARKKFLKVSTMRPVRCVYHAPVLTHTCERVDLTGALVFARVRTRQSACATAVRHLFKLTQYSVLVPLRYAEDDAGASAAHSPDSRTSLRTNPVRRDTGLFTL